MTLSLDTAYRSFGGEVEASSTPTICRLPDSRRHQLWAIARYHFRSAPNSGPRQTNPASVKRANFGSGCIPFVSASLMLASFGAVMGVEGSMKLSAKPEGVMERMALLLNLAPLPLIDTQIAFSNARAIMAAAALGMFEQLGQGEKTADEIAAACQTNPVATQHLLNCLVG